MLLKKCAKNPYWNLGPSCNIPQKLEEANFKTFRKEEKDFYYKHRSLLTDVLIHQDNVWPITIYLNLELFYRAAVEFQKMSVRKADNSTPQENVIEHSSNASISKSRLRRRLLSLFKK